MRDVPAPRQLVFGLDLPPASDARDFLVGPSNAQAADMLGRWPDWPSPTLVLTGPRGSGKTHLGSVWAARAGAEAVKCPDLSEGALPDLLRSGALLVDDIEPDTIPATILFHLLNQAGEVGAAMLLTTRHAPAAWSLQLADLASRLRALPVVAIGAPDDVLLRKLIVKLLADRQLEIDAAVLDFVCLRMERSFDAAQRIVATLDRLALEERRPLTRSLASRALAEAGAEG